MDAHTDEDHIYKEEMLEMARNGVLHEVHTAYSRLPGQPKVNVAAARVLGGADWWVPWLLSSLPLGASTYDF